MQELPDSSRVIYLQLKDWFPGSESGYLMHVSQVLWETVYEPVERSLIDAHRLLDQLEIERGPNGHPYHVTERIIRLARQRQAAPVDTVATTPLTALAGPVAAPGPTGLAQPALASIPGWPMAARGASASGLRAGPMARPTEAATGSMAAPAATGAVGGPGTTLAGPPAGSSTAPWPPPTSWAGAKRRPQWRRRLLVGSVVAAMILAGAAGLTVKQASGYPNGAVARLAWREAGNLPPVQSWLADQVSGLGWHPDPQHPGMAVRQRWSTSNGHWVRAVERVPLGSQAFCATFPNDPHGCRRASA